MNKEIIEVPCGVQYISEWSEYKLPKGEHCIVDKGVTGCGYTEFCLTNGDNVILCSPRKLLLRNKKDQHKHDQNILYLENDIKDHTGVAELEGKIISHIQLCMTLRLPVKIMVTYDSLHYVSELLFRLGELERYVFVVDEFQSIFLDSYFKSSVEFDFIEALQICPSVIYLSATPMLDKYLDRLPEFQNLTFYKLDWLKTGYVETIKVKRGRVASLGSECGKIVSDYLDGKFPMTLDSSGKPTQSKEAVFYFNSVTEILRVIRKYKLTPKNTLIICSETPENAEKLGKLGFSLGRVPLKGEPYPMFIFCTSAIYMGIDFYSPCAKSFIFADPNVECLALDISLDLPQIIGRQRDKSNPFKNDIVIFYKTKRKGEKDLTQEEFDKLQAQRRESTKILLREFNNMSTEGQVEYLGKLKRDSELYVYDFVSISKNTNTPVYNTLIDIANERAWEVSQKDYQDTLTVTKAIQDAGFLEEKYQSQEDIIVSDFLDNYFYKTGIFSDKMKMYCEFCDQYKDNSEIMATLDHKIDDLKYKGYYTFYGTKGCSSRKYQEADLLRGWQGSTLESKLETMIRTQFKVGDRYSKADIKSILAGLYSQLGITKTPKATDLGNYFSLAKTRVTLPDKTVKDGFKLGVL